MSVQKLPENRFIVQYLGRDFPFCRQSALEQIELRGLAARLTPMLLTGGVPAAEAQALACNCVLLWQVLENGEAGNVPEDILRRFTLRQIADLCELYWKQYDFSEFAVNESYDQPERAGDEKHG
ncbi:MAG: hypothetical protein PHU30_06935 [Oscillospiraceae bacterium]|nr:hypothetical protein [Oscillospiraceae bacterium]